MKKSFGLKFLTVILTLTALFCFAFAFGCQPQHTHQFDRQVTLKKYMATQPSCETKATYYYSCKCGKAGTETFAAGELGDHNFADGSCSVCQGKLGDANGDGKINVLDLVKYTRIIAKLDDPNAFADVNQDGMIDSADATLVRLMILG